MNHIKSDTRNRLGEILNELMILYDITEHEKATIDIPRWMISREMEIR